MNRKYLWLGVGLVVGVALVIGLVLFNQVYYSVGLAFSSLQLLTEVQSDLLEHHLRQANLLFIRAEQLLRIPSHPLNSGHLAGALTIAYSRISSLGLALRPGEIVIWMILLALTVGIFWIEEQRIDRLQEERKKLYSQWMAITTAWTGNHILTHSDQVITKVLEQVKKEINLDGVEIWRWRSDPHNALSVFSSTNVSLLHESLPVPQIFLEAHMGLLGQVILKQQAIYSEEYSDVVGVLPGLRIANVALLPLYMQDNLWGFFILWRGDHGWYYQHRDALTIIAMQISTMLTHAELEKQARQADVYQQMAKARSELLANVSHELRTPLGLIKGYGETLLQLFDRLEMDERKEFLTVIVDESQELEKLINNLLHMSQIEEQGIDLQLRNFPVKSWIYDLLRRIVPEERPRIHIMTDDQMGYGDPEYLFEALVNMVENSLKYSNGGIRIMTGFRDSVWSLSVEDDGPGVKAHDLEKIFQRFYRSVGAAQSEKRGSGLGLSIVKRIVDAHHGHVWAENVSPQGFAVTVELPRAESGKGSAGNGYSSRH